MLSAVQLQSIDDYPIFGDKKIKPLFEYFKLIVIQIKKSSNLAFPAFPPFCVQLAF